MNYSTGPKFKLLLAGLAAVTVFLPALIQPLRASTHKSLAVPISSSSNQNLILFKRGTLDTNDRVDLDTSEEDRQELLAMSATLKKQTRVIQFAGPIKRKWIDALRATGADIVGYLPNNAYIIRANSRELAVIAALDAGRQSDDTRPIRWMGRLLAATKIDPSYADEALNSIGNNVRVEVELIDSPESTAAIEFINRAAESGNGAPRKFLNFTVLSVTVATGRLLEIAAFDEVLFVGPALEPSLQDERSAQIVGGNLIADGTRPNAPGYLGWLASNGLDIQAEFVVDFTDSGLDRGSTSAVTLHPDFLDPLLRSRVAYSINYATDGLIDDRTGHGTIVASVAVGRGEGNRKDAPGYLYGLGVDPVAKIGASRIFDERGKVSSHLSFTDVASAAYSAGAVISNNSWGNASNSYDSIAQEYDALVRDAQPSRPGNQGMSFVFSVANFGPGGHVGSPATAKNVISVAASENYRPEGIDSCNLDGQGDIGPDGADNALDILRYSGGGPTADRRAKPDIAAPGTHVYGAASQSPGFFGEGLCAGRPVFQPPDQSLYTWSSGTSLAAPHISGAASLLRKFVVSRNLLGNATAPSPAMTKAYLINAASYMTGENAGGDLPHERQGWGLVNLSRAFDGTARVLVDQTDVFTESGQTFELQGSIADRALPLRVTLAWSDPPGSLVGPAIVNDLDLEVTVGGVTLYRGNNFAGAFSVEGGNPDSLNNLESIYLPPGAIPRGVEGNFRITVRAANIAGDGLPGNALSLDQDFALVVYNIASLIEPPPPPPPPKVPVINTATWKKKTLTITGRDFTNAAQVEINGMVINRSFNFDHAVNSLSIRLKPRKLNLVEGENQILLIENGQRSQSYVLRL
ncbi:MAG: S8 family serine peptidase [Blastocatellia bacterium]